MGIGVSIFLIAVGAVMTFALDVNSHGGFSIDTIGLILMGVGAIGLLVALVIMGSSRDRGATIVER